MPPAILFTLRSNAARSPLDPGEDLFNRTGVQDGPSQFFPIQIGEREKPSVQRSSRFEQVPDIFRRQFPSGVEAHLVDQPRKEDVSPQRFTGKMQRGKAASIDRLHPYLRLETG
jgi:hypothetical protein